MPLKSSVILVTFPVFGCHTWPVSWTVQMSVSFVIMESSTGWHWYKNWLMIGLPQVLSRPEEPSINSQQKEDFGRINSNRLFIVGVYFLLLECVNPVFLSKIWKVVWSAQYLSKKGWVCLPGYETGWIAFLCTRSVFFCFSFSITSTGHFSQSWWKTPC